MSHPAIRVEHLSKRYQVGELTSKYDYITFREALVRAATAPIQRLRMLRGQVPATQSIWALKDVSFEVQPGEVVGIIGRNGAGKSTLLKILSQITEPTQGRVEMRGRVASLLEVGTGFHPELTGRENIYLNGAILGMTRREIESKFDQIVDFSGVERFIDTPVKRYSTGMYLRLAFAVAAHLDPEILIVDEVLAVGDAAFQKKCLGRMGEVARSGRTVLFVSHNMPAVRAICRRALLLNNGSIARDGDATVVVNHYVDTQGQRGDAELVWPQPEARPGNNLFRLIALRVINANGEVACDHRSSQDIFIEMEFELTNLHEELCVAFDVVKGNDVIVFRSTHNDGPEDEWPTLRIGHNRLRCRIPGGLLSFGTYSVTPRINLHRIAWVIDGGIAVRFNVDLDHSTSRFWAYPTAWKFPGVIAPCLEWQAF